MKELMQNFEFFKDDNPKNIRPFIMACRDYEAEDERWILACLTEEETRVVYENLKKVF